MSTFPTGRAPRKGAPVCFVPGGRRRISCGRFFGPGSSRSASVWGRRRAVLKALGARLPGRAQARGPGGLDARAKTRAWIRMKSPCRGTERLGRGSAGSGPDAAQGVRLPTPWQSNPGGLDGRFSGQLAVRLWGLLKAFPRGDCGLSGASGCAANLEGADAPGARVRPTSACGCDSSRGRASGGVEVQRCRLAPEVGRGGRLIEGARGTMVALPLAPGNRSNSCQPVGFPTSGSLRAPFLRIRRLGLWSLGEKHRGDRQGANPYNAGWTR